MLKKGGVHYIGLVLFMVLFALSFGFTNVYRPDSDSQLSVWLFVLGFIVCALIIYINLFLIKIDRTYEVTLSDKKWFCIIFLFTIICGVFFQLVYYPATASNDTIFVIRGGLGTSSQHPWLYIIPVRAVRKIVAMLGGTDYHTLLVCAFLQIVVTAFTYAVCMTWLKRKHVSNMVIILLSIILLGCPILNLYMITIIKDVPFSLGMMLMIPLLYEVWESEGKVVKDSRFCLLFLGCSILLFFRNNGIYICWGLALFLMLFYVKQWKRILVYAGFLIMLMGTTRMIQNHANAKYLFREAVGIPIQQIAATIYYDGSISNDQKEFINQILPLEFIETNYDPYNVDTLKYGEVPFNDEYLNKNKIEFVKIWFDLMLSNPKIFIEAQLKTTYGFWSFSNSTYKMRYTYIGAFAKENAFSDWILEHHIKTKCIFPNKIQEKLEGILDSISIFFGAGTTIWILMCLIICIVLKHGWKAIIIGMPSILCWGTLLFATPIAFQWRYALSFVYSLIMLFGILHIIGNKDVSML